MVWERLNIVVPSALGIDPAVWLAEVDCACLRPICIRVLDQKTCRTPICTPRMSEPGGGAPNSWLAGHMA